MRAPVRLSLFLRYPLAYLWKSPGESDEAHSHLSLFRGLKDWTPKQNTSHSVESFRI